MENNIIKPSSIKIGLLGDTTVGKSAIANSIIGLEFSKFDSELMATIGSDKFEKKFKLKNNEDIKLIIWDVCGTERFRSAAFKTIKPVKGIILIFDLTRKESFNNLYNWLKGIKDNLTNPFIVLFGNKADIEKDKWGITSEEASKFAKENRIAYFEVSAKTKLGLNEGLSCVVNGAYDKLMGYDDDKNIDLEKITSNKNSNCAGNKNGKNSKK